MLGDWLPWAVLLGFAIWVLAYRPEDERPPGPQSRGPQES
jgi:hypothetical protein